MKGRVLRCEGESTSCSSETKARIGGIKTIEGDKRSVGVRVNYRGKERKKPRCRYRHAFTHTALNVLFYFLPRTTM